MGNRFSRSSVYRETEVERTDLETVIDEFPTGQFDDRSRRRLQHPGALGSGNPRFAFSKLSMLSDEIFPPPGACGSTLSRPNRHAFERVCRFRYGRNNAALSVAHPTKDNSQFSRATLQSLITAVYI